MDDLVKRLRGWYDASADEIHEEAADAIESLLRQSSLTRKLAIEEAAKAVEDSGGDNADWHAEKVRALSPSINEAEMVERATLALVNAKVGYRPQAQYSYDTVLARAVLRTLGITTEEGATSEN